MTRIGICGASVLTLALLTSACSGGSGSAAKDTPPTKAQATAAAKAINLTKADVAADFTSSPADNSDNSGKAIPEDVATCLGLKSSDTGGDDLVDLSSDDFSKGAPPNGVQVGSEVEVVASTQDAKKLLGILKSAKASDCLGKSFEKELKSELGTGTPGVSLGKVQVSTLSPDADGTDGTFGFKLVIPVQGPGITIQVTTEIRGFLNKHTEVTLLSVSFGSGAAVDSDALYAKLVDRAKTSAV